MLRANTKFDNECLYYFSTQKTMQRDFFSFGIIKFKNRASFMAFLFGFIKSPSLTNIFKVVIMYSNIVKSVFIHFDNVFQKNLK